MGFSACIDRGILLGAWETEAQISGEVILDVTLHDSCSAVRSTKTVDLTSQAAYPESTEISGGIDRALIELTPDAIYIHQHERVAFANQATARLLGFRSPSALIGRSIWDLIHPSWHCRVRERIRSLNEAERTSVPLLEQQFVAESGAVIEVEATATTIPFGDGQAVLVIVRDITERKRAQEELRQSEAKYRAIFENAIEGIFQSSPSGQYLNVNPAYARMFGYESPQEMLYCVSDIANQIYLDPSDRGRFLEIMNTSAEVRGVEWRLRRRDGTPIWVRENLRSVRNSAGVLLYYEGIVEEITKEKAAQDALRQAEGRFSAAFHASPDGITISTLNEGRYIDVNQAYSQLIGLTPSELIGKTSTELGLWTDIRVRQELIRQVQERGFVRAFPMEMRTRSGKVKQIEISADCIELNGVSCLLAILRDVTDTKMMEQQLRQAQKMQAIGQLAGGIAHDFNNALMVIDSYADLANETADDRAALTSHLSQILKASHRAAKLTSQLLAFSRKQPILKETIELGQFFLNASDAWQRMLGEKTKVELAISSGPFWCSVSAAQLENAMLNLLLNARDAMPGGGSIEISLYESKLTQQLQTATGIMPSGDFVCVKIRDTGHGISPDHLEHVFEPFFTTKPKGVGTGLGLASVYGIVAQSSGYIDVSSRRNFGTTFTLYFPAVEGKPRKDEPVIANSLTLKVASGSVLLVEDNESLLSALTGWIEAKGFRVLSAPNGEEALKLAENHQIDILISDIVMPGMSGNVLYRLLKSRIPSIRTILMSGYQEEAVVNEPGLQYLSKPFSFSQLSTALSHVTPTPRAEHTAFDHPLASGYPT